MEGLGTAAAAPSCCCQLIIITPFHTHTRASHLFFRRTPTAEQATYKTAWQLAKRGNRKLEKILSPRELFVDFLVAQDGLLHAAGISGVWTDSRSDKRRPFVQNDLTHFIDDQVEILASTRGACCGAAKARPPPASVCPRQPMGSLVTLGGRVLMLPAPARAGARHGPFTRRAAAGPPPGRPVPLASGELGYKVCVSTSPKSNNKAWQQCGVEERWKGWQLLLRRLPAAGIIPHTHSHISSV